MFCETRILTFFFLNYEIFQKINYKIKINNNKKKKTLAGAAQQEESNKAMRSLEELSEQRQIELRERIKSLQAQHCQAINLLQSQLIESRGEVERLTRQVDEMVAAAAKSKPTDANGGVEPRTFSPNGSGVFHRTSSSPRIDPIVARGLVVTIQDESTEVTGLIKPLKSIL